MRLPLTATRWAFSGGATFAESRQFLRASAANPREEQHSADFQFMLRLASRAIYLSARSQRIDGADASTSLRCAPLRPPYADGEDRCRCRPGGPWRDQCGGASAQVACAA